MGVGQGVGHTTSVQRALQYDREIEALNGLGAAKIGEGLANRPYGPGLHGTSRWDLDIRPVDAKLNRDKGQQKMHTTLTREREALAECPLRLGPERGDVLCPGPARVVEEQHERAGVRRRDEARHIGRMIGEHRVSPATQQGQRIQRERTHLPTVKCPHPFRAGPLRHHCRRELHHGLEFAIVIQIVALEEEPHDHLGRKAGRDAIDDDQLLHRAEACDGKARHRAAKPRLEPARDHVGIVVVGAFNVGIADQRHVSLLQPRGVAEAERVVAEGERVPPRGR